MSAALRSCPVPVVVGGITSDRFLPAAAAGGAGRGTAWLHPNVVESIYGHDGIPGRDRGGRSADPPHLDCADAEGARRP